MQPHRRTLTSVEDNQERLNLSNYLMILTQQAKKKNESIKQDDSPKGAIQTTFHKKTQSLNRNTIVNQSYNGPILKSPQQKQNSNDKQVDQKTKNTKNIQNIIDQQQRLKDQNLLKEIKMNNRFSQKHKFVQQKSNPMLIELSFQSNLSQENPQLKQQLHQNEESLETSLNNYQLKFDDNQFQEHDQQQKFKDITNNINRHKKNNSLQIFEKQISNNNEIIKMENKIDQFMHSLEQSIFNHGDSGGHLVNFLKNLTNDSQTFLQKLILKIYKMVGMVVCNLQGDIKEMQKKLIGVDLVQKENLQLDQKIQKLIQKIEITSQTSFQFELLQKQNLKLKNQIEKQKEYLNESIKKDEKVMQLLNSLRNRGINIEQIFHQEQKIQQAKNQVSQKDKYMEKYNLQKLKNDNIQQNRDINSQSLDFTKYKSNDHDIKKKSIQDNKLTKKPNLQGVNCSTNDLELQGFHQEFMAKFDEFSESWRQAARKEKQF